MTSPRAGRRIAADAAPDGAPRVASRIPPGPAPPLDRRLRPAQVALVGLFVIALLGTAWWAKPVLMPVLSAMVLATLLKPIVGRLEAVHVPCPVGAFIVISLLTAGIFVAIELLLEPMARLLDSMPAMESLLFRLLRAARESFGQPFGTWLQNRITDFAATQTGPASTGLFSAFVDSWVTTGTILLLAFFLLAAGDHFLQSLVQMLPRIRDKVNAVRIVRTVQGEVSHYFLTVTAINVVLGVSIGLLCAYLDVPNALLWGTLVALLNFLPYVGPLLIFVLLSIVCAAHFSALSEVATIPLAYAVVTILEGHIITPTLVGKRVALNPVVVFTGLLFWGWLWGIAGMVLAIPLLLVAKIWAQHTPALAPWAEFLGPQARPGHAVATASLPGAPAAGGPPRA